MTAPRTMKETERIQGQGGPGRGGPFGGGMVGQKPLDFGPSIKRLIKRLRTGRTTVGNRRSQAPRFL